MIQPSTVNGIVSRLEEKGLITRAADARDGRCRILTLTESGHSVRDGSQQAIAQVEQQMEQGFTAEELTQLRALLLRVADNLTQKPQEVDQ